MNKKKVVVGKRKTNTLKRRKRYFPPKKTQRGLVNLNGKRLKVGTSQSESMWLDQLGVPVRQVIIRGFNNKTYVIDGADPTKKIAYEFLGCYFHGHYTHMNLRQLNTLTKKTYGQMYAETKARFQYLYDTGWRVWFCWECDYKNGKLGRFYTGMKDML